ncbi:aspartate dehydrogenase [Oceanimonas sp. NS1]|nr:aspartate dehydrogenase [Oceanimonas sp. NS1]
MKQLMMIGFGAMAREVLALLPAELSLKWLLVPASRVAEVQAELGPAVTVLSRVEDCAATPDLVVECAGQAAVREHGSAVLARGWTLGLISVGALADEALARDLRLAAAQGEGRILALAGAIAGIDGLAAAREGGLEAVTYQGRKSPQSWRGSRRKAWWIWTVSPSRRCSSAARRGRRRGCSRPMPTWRRPSPWPGSAWTTPGSNWWWIRTAGATSTGSGQRPFSASWTSP